MFLDSELPPCRFVMTRTKTTFRLPSPGETCQVAEGDQASPARHDNSSAIDNDRVGQERKGALTVVPQTNVSTSSTTDHLYHWVSDEVRSMNSVFQPDSEPDLPSFRHLLGSSMEEEWKIRGVPTKEAMCEHVPRGLKFMVYAIMIFELRACPHFNDFE